MTRTDIRLAENEKLLLAGMIGKTLDEFIHDECTVNHTTYMSAWLIVEDDVYEVHCEVEARDYFGDVEDVAVANVLPSQPENIHPRLVGHPLSSDRIARTIQDVKIVEDAQEMIENDRVVHTFSFTAAIIFELEGTKLMLEFGPWFSEDIGIRRGPQADRKLPAAIDSIPKEARKWYRVNRETVSMREWVERQG